MRALRVTLHTRASGKRPFTKTEPIGDSHDSLDERDDGGEGVSNKGRDCGQHTADLVLDILEDRAELLDGQVLGPVHDARRVRDDVANNVPERAFEGVEQVLEEREDGVHDRGHVGCHSIHGSVHGSNRSVDGAPDVVDNGVDDGICKGAQKKGRGAGEFGNVSKRHRERKRCSRIWETIVLTLTRRPRQIPERLAPT